MKISGFSYVRNGFDYDVPFLEAIQSILPICDEFVIAVGDSSDGTREAITALNSSKIKIIDTVWEMNLKGNGELFAQQTNIALDHITGDWAFHIQADEVIHEDSLPLIANSIEKYAEDEKVEGFILPFLHFWGDYYHVRNTRRVHNHEVRIIRNNKTFRSYKDSQGFRKYKSIESYTSGLDKGEKLHVKKIDASVFHYNGVRQENRMIDRVNKFRGFYAGHQDITTFDFSTVDRVKEFTKTNPKVMQARIDAYNFSFVHDTSKAIWKPKDRIMQPIEDFLNFKIGEYKNYKLLK